MKMYKCDEFLEWLVYSRKWEALLIDLTYFLWLLVLVTFSVSVAFRLATMCGKHNATNVKYMKMYNKNNSDLDQFYWGFITYLPHNIIPICGSIVVQFALTEMNNIVNPPVKPCIE